MNLNIRIIILCPFYFKLKTDIEGQTFAGI